MDLPKLTADAQAEVKAADNLETLDQIRVHYLGKKGELTALLKTLGTLPADERKSAGQEINQAKRDVQQAIDVRKQTLEQEKLQARLASESVDVTLPGRGQKTGGLHPVTRTMARIESLFSQLGFSVVEGPEIEDDFHNFEVPSIIQPVPCTTRFILMLKPCCVPTPHRYRFVTWKMKNRHCELLRRAVFIVAIQI